MKKMKFGRYDYASFAMFAAYAAVSVVIPVALVDMAHDLGFPLEEGGTGIGGWLPMVRSIAICIALVAGGFIAGRWGNRRPLGLATLLIFAGIMACAVSPSFWILVFVLTIAGVGEGIVEALGTPFVQQLHADEPGRYMNFSHGFWSFGVVVSTLLFGWMLHTGVSWRVTLALAASFALIPTLLMLAPRARHKPVYPERPERLPVARVLSQSKAICRNFRFWLFFGAMLFAGGAEIGITFWLASLVQLEFGGTAMEGGIATAVYAAGMLAGRTGFGFLLHQRHLKGLVIGTGIAAALASLLIPSLANSDLTWKLNALYAVLFIAGLGTAPHWPSIQTYAVERLPNLDMTMVYVLLSCAGVPGSGIMSMLIGYLAKPGILGLANAFYIAPAAFAIMILFLLSDGKKTADGLKNVKQ